MKKILFVLISLTFNVFYLSAQKTLTVSGEYTYNVPSHISLDMAKATALDRAKIAIIADNFGTVMGVSNTTSVKNDIDNSSVSFLSISESEVKGEWIETIGEPKFEISSPQGMLVIKVNVKGRIREISTARIPFDAKILRNGIEDKYESNTFKDGDELFISFQTPSDGYLTIYLYDQTGVNRLLPLMGDKNGSQFISSGRREILFVRKAHNTISSEYVMTCNFDNEMNRIYIIFSPNRYYRANDLQESSSLPASLSFEDFQKWLSKTRRQDTDMCLMVKDIIINH